MFYVRSLLKGNPSIKDYELVTRSEYGPNHVYKEMFEEWISSKDATHVPDAFKFTLSTAYFDTVK